MSPESNSDGNATDPAPADQQPAKPKSRGGRNYVRKGLRAPKKTGFKTLKSATDAATDTMARAVRTLAQIGLGFDAMAARMGVDENWLKVEHRRAFLLGIADAEAATKQTAYQIANGSPAVFDEKGRQIRAEQKPNVEMLKYLLGARFGWKQGLTISAPDGGPVQFQITDAQLAEMSDEDLAAIEAANCALSRIVADHDAGRAGAPGETPARSRAR